MELVYLFYLSSRGLLSSVGSSFLVPLTKVAHQMEPPIRLDSNLKLKSSKFNELLSELLLSLPLLAYAR